MKAVTVPVWLSLLSGSQQLAAVPFHWISSFRHLSSPQDLYFLNFFSFQKWPWHSWIWSYSPGCEAFTVVLILMNTACFLLFPLCSAMALEEPEAGGSLEVPHLTLVLHARERNNGSSPGKCIFLSSSSERSYELFGWPPVSVFLHSSFGLQLSLRAPWALFSRDSFFV